MLTPNFSNEMSPLTTQYTRQSTKSSLSRTFIYFSCPNFISYYCLCFIYISMFWRISRRSLIFSRTLCSIMNFSILSAVLGIFISGEVESTAIVLIPNSSRLNLEASISSRPAAVSFNFNKGMTMRSQSLHHDDV